MIKIRGVDATHIKIDAEPSILMELRDSFSFFVKGYQFMPKYKAKMWDGKINLINLMNRRMTRGLLKEVLTWAENNGYETETDAIRKDPASLEAIQQFLESLPLSNGKDSIEARGYQLAAAIYAIKNERALLLSPTASGKSLILYLIMRWHLAYGRKCLIIVPTIQLVSQMASDFRDYAAFDHGFDADEYTVGTVVGGKHSNPNAPLQIATWQSLQRAKPEYFKSFDVVAVDECHLASAATITRILESCVNAYHRIGTTGTLDGSKTNELVLTGLIGPVRRVITTKELMENQSVSELKIEIHSLKYPEVEAKARKSEKWTYQEEVRRLVGDERRNRHIIDTAGRATGNVLVLFQFVEQHGHLLRDMAESMASTYGKEVCYIDGSMSADHRESIRYRMETQSNLIVLASVQTTSTGVNFKNLTGIVFASPTKSTVRVLQSIGRGLRKAANKTHCTLYDIADDLRWKSNVNYSYAHLLERLQVYTSEQFEYDLHEYDIQ